MQTDKTPRPHPVDGAVAPATPVPMSDEALARRRLLLKGLGKGSAAVAVMVPIQTLAAGTLLPDDKLCTVSGVQSNVGSKVTNELGTSTCRGYSPAYYSNVANWPNGTGTDTDPANSVDGIAFLRTTPFNAVFPGGVATPMLDILTTSPASDEAVWITALLNGVAQTAGHNFPYSASEVRAFYNNPSAQIRADALFFFRQYVQGVGF